jgi:multiple sugar transport system permease protein
VSAVGVRGARSSRRWFLSRLRRVGFSATFVAPATVLLGVLSLYPIYVLVRMSISQVDLTNILGYWPIVGLKNFQDVLTSSQFQAVTVQTLLFVAIVLVATMLVGLLVAVLLRSSSGFSWVTQITMILVWTLPLVIVGSLWKFLLSSDGAVNQILKGTGIIGSSIPFLSQPSTALFGVALAAVWVGVPFTGLVIKSAILDVPDDILDAARVDGASGRQLFWRIVLPMIRPTLLILAVLTVVGAFKAFDLIYTMTKGGPGTSSTTIPFLGYTTALQEYRFDDAAAISVIAMVIVLLLAVGYILAVRREER